MAKDAIGNQLAEGAVVAVQVGGTLLYGRAIAVKDGGRISVPVPGAHKFPKQQITVQPGSVVVNFTMTFATDEAGTCGGVIAVHCPPELDRLIPGHKHPLESVEAKR